MTVEEELALERLYVKMLMDVIREKHPEVLITLKNMVKEHEQKL